MKKEVFLLDGHSIVFRSYYAFIRNPLKNAKGENTSAIFGFVNTLRKILNQFKPDYIACVFDSKEETFRHKVFEEYKKERAEPPSDLAWQIPVIKELVKSYGIKTFEIEGYEADDVLASLAKKLAREEFKVYIVSSDKDLMQIVNDKILLYDTYKEIFYDPKKIQERFGVGPEKIVDILSLMGDQIDNVPGVKGIGEKRAVEIIKRYGSLELALEKDERLKGQKKEALFSKSLIELKQDIEIEAKSEELKIGNIDKEKLTLFFKELGFRTFLEDFLACEEKKTAPDIKTSPLSELLSTYEYFAFAKKEKKIFLATQEDKLKVYEGDIGDARINQLLLSNSLKIGYDFKSILKQGVKLAQPFFDLKIAAYLIEPTRKRFELSDIILTHLKTLTKAEEAKEVAYYSFLLYKQLLPELLVRNLSEVFYHLEMPLIPVLCQMEERGIKIDVQFFFSFEKELKEESRKVEREIYDLVGLRFNLNSPKQLSEVLYEKLGLPVDKRKGFSTAQDVLLALLPHSPVIEKILRYRELSKLISTYIKPFLELKDERDRLHTVFDQTKTATGRLASLEPNLQNIPIRGELGQKMRKGFIAEDGYLLLSADYSQIELRLLAHITDDESLKEIFLRDEDIHTTTAQKILKLKKEEVKEEHRRIAKSVNYGLIYGMSEFGLQESLGISQKEAQEFITNYLNSFPKVKEWREKVIEEAKESGYTKTIFGRIRPFFELLSPNRAVYEAARRAAINAPIQGSAADLIKKAMIEVTKKIKEKGFKGGLVLTIHDELLFEIEEERVREAERIIRETMENVFQLSVPLKVKTGVGRNWSLAHPG